LVRTVASASASGRDASLRLARRLRQGLRMTDQAIAGEKPGAAQI